MSHRERSDFRRFLHFIAVGVLNTLIGVGLFAVAFALTGNHLVAAYAAAVLAILAGFLLTGTVVFDHLSWRSLLLYILWYAVLASFNALLIHVAVRFGLNPYLASLAASPAVVAVSWLMNRYVIFSPAYRDRGHPDVTNR